jgi:ornithine decarboxylase
MKSAALLQLGPRSDSPLTFADAADVARKLNPDEPVFCFSAATLTTQFHRFVEGFPGEVSYAVKANPEPHVLATMAAAGCAVWDVASPDEMAAVRAVSESARFHYHNPIKSRHELREAYVRFGCRRFAVDCGEELDKISDVLGIGGDIEIAVRFVLPRDDKASAHDFSSKFGADVRDAAALLREAARRGYGTVLTFHPGSQCRSPRAYRRHIEAAAGIAVEAKIALDVLNVGGGFPAHYPYSSAPEPENYFAAINDAMVRAFAGRRPKLECEPGRCLVASSHSLLTRIKLVRRGNEIFLNEGIYGALLECAQVPELVPSARAIRIGSACDGSLQDYKVFGPTCDPLDVLPGRLTLPAGMREGDYVEFGSLGAYGSATATRFNGYGVRELVEVA